MNNRIIEQKNIRSQKYWMVVAQGNPCASARVDSFCGSLIFNKYSKVAWKGYRKKPKMGFSSKGRKLIWEIPIYHKLASVKWRNLQKYRQSRWRNFKLSPMNASILMKGRIATVIAFFVDVSFQPNSQTTAHWPLLKYLFPNTWKILKIN